MGPTAWRFILIYLASAAIAAQSDKVTITEWDVPIRMDQDMNLADELPTDIKQQTRPRDPYVDGRGRVWFCGQAGNYLAYLEPDEGTFRRYDLEPGTHPHNLIIDPNDQVWYAGNRNAHIGRLDPASGAIKKFTLPEGVNDPHTLIWDQHGDIWFTAQFSNVIGRLRTGSGEVDVVHLPAPRSRPYGIVMDSANRPWIVLFGTNAIATVDPASLELKVYALPQEKSRPRRIAITGDDQVWYVDYSLGRLGRLNPETGEVKEWSAPSGAGALPYAMTVDDRDRLWFVESPEGRSHLVGFDPATELFFSDTPLPSGGLTVRHMVFHPDSREIWFGADSNTIGRAKVP